MKLSPFLCGVALTPYLLAFQAGPKPTQLSGSVKDRAEKAREILSARCGSCHGETDPAGGLTLTTEKGLKAGGDSGPVFAAGNAKTSLLIHRVRGDDHQPRMPKGFAPLSESDIKVLSAWIDDGAPFVTERHWAYIAPVRPPLPKVKNSAWCKTPIDRFILAQLDKQGLKPSPRASKEILIRRLSLDLIGLPPTPAEVTAFLNDESPNAYEKVVDRLLASPHYGEKQARPWLDLARYADSNGYEKDAERSIWPYRDWVINAYNANMPYDEFTIEQIAGDLLPNATLQQRIATGFNRNVMLNEEGGVDQGEQRWLRLIDMVGTTAQTWMGTTLACAQCHDHKYDPFSQKDFYKFLAFFESSEAQSLELRPELARQRAELRAQIQKDQDLLNKKDPSVAPDKLQKEEKELNKLTGPWTLVFQETPGGKDETHLRIRGGYLSPGELLKADTPAMLPALAKSAPRNRLTLARWIVSTQNPLTARVQVNRMWEELFGTGIVETSENFGTQGSKPSHPELLDWMATEFERRHWDMKAINKMIVMSAVYQQSSAVTPDRLAKDPKNEWLSRGPRFRLEAETIRDNALAIAGMLSPKIGGPSVFPSQPEGIWDSPYSGETWTYSKGADKYRRGLYTFWKRTATYPSFVLLDATSREACTVRRIRTNTPLQALALMNDAAYLDAAKGLAHRMDGASSSLDKKLDFGFKLCVSRAPAPAETERLAALYKKLVTRYKAEPKEASKLATSPEKAAMVMVANVLLNLDETISKT